MPSPIRCNGLSDTDALYYVLNLDGQAALHWPAGVPTVVAESLAIARDAAQAFYDAVEYAGALLVGESVEGVETETTPFVVDFGDQDDELDETGDDDTDDGDQWKTC